MEWRGDEEAQRRRAALRSLGLEDDGDEMPSMKQVQDAWRNKAKELHPDVQKRNGRRNDDDDATAKFRSAREAFELEVQCSEGDNVD